MITYLLAENYDDTNTEGRLGTRNARYTGYEKQNMHKQANQMNYKKNRSNGEWIMENGETFTGINRERQEKRMLKKGVHE